MRGFYVVSWLIGFTLFNGNLLHSQDLLNDEIQFSGLTLDLVEYARLPNGHRSILSMSSPSFDDRLFVSSASGRIYAIDESDSGNQPSLWFDAGRAIRTATGRALNFGNRAHGGLRSFAFHPEFERNGKLYVSVMEDRPANPSQHHYLGESPSNVAADSALLEFTYDFEQQQVDPNSYRELFRVNMPFYDHPIKQIQFNQFARPGEKDYGLLYVTHGDASVQSAIAGGGQNRDDALGKVLRIDPLQQASSPYTTPASPFADNEETLDEIFALGFRNPHNLSFAVDSDDHSRLVIADIGRDNVEEVNLVDPGEDYGWSSREGTFVHRNSGGGFINGVRPLPANEVENGYTYPVAMFDHDARVGQGFAGIAIAGAHVIANRSELQGEYIFGEFGNSGKLYHASFEDMLGAVTKLDADDPARDEPSELTQAEVSQLRLRFDHDNDPSTPFREFDTFTALLNRSRSDLRFGEGSQGELYLSSKQDGRVYLVTNTLSSLYDSDFDGDRRVNASDIDILVSQIGMPEAELRFDVNQDGTVTEADLLFLVETSLGTKPGDTDLNGTVDFADFLQLSSKFGQTGGWADGNFDADNTVNFADFLALSSNFESENQVTQVPEPQGSAWVWSAILALFVSGRKNLHCRASRSTSRPAIGRP